jgi:hypothetical protein
VTTLDIDHGFGLLDVRFDGDEGTAQLEASGAIAERMTLERDGKRLVVGTKDNGPSFGGWSWLFGTEDEQWATLTLPPSLEGVDLDLDSGAGSVTVDGALGDVDIETGAGEVRLSGSADAVTAEVGAGQAVFDLRDVETFSADVSAGALFVTLTGEAPSELALDISAGGGDVVLPDEAYALNQEVSAGELDASGLRIDSTSTHRIDVRLTAGGVTLSSDGDEQF